MLIWSFAFFDRKERIKQQKNVSQEKGKHSEQSKSWQTGVQPDNRRVPNQPHILVANDAINS